VKQKYFWS